MAFSASDLLSGPRGRRLCLELAIGAGDDDDEALRTAVFFAAHDLDPGRGTSRVLLSVGSGDGDVDRPRPAPADVARLLDETPLRFPSEPELLRALVAAVDTARYWQEPEGEDVLAAAPELRAALMRVAETITDSVRAGWWGAPVERGDQWRTRFDSTGSPKRSTVSERLARWRADTVEEETVARRDRPSDPRADWSGSWWSAPPGGVPHTARSLPHLGPVGLRLVEDSLGWERATTSRVAVPDDVTVFEIDGPDAWAELCRRYPLEVTASRRHDWFRATGQDSRWVIPDWSLAAQDLGGVHLTVVGYLTAAGRPVPVADGAAGVLAGWGPDETYWFVDVAEGESEQRWEIADGSWARANT
jgi:hypothetical protein